jgi:transcription elongation factor Elf1
MKCLIEGCQEERGDLQQHIRLDHKLSIQEYKEMFNVKYVIDEEKRMKRGASRRKTNQETKQFKCEICGEACVTQPSLYKHCFYSKDPKHSHLIFNSTNSNEWVECKICGMRKGRIDFHLKIDHKITKQEYTSKYPDPLYSNNFIEKTTIAGKSVSKEIFKGEKNPFYGKCHSEESRKSISDTIKKNNSKNIIHHNKGRTHTEQTKSKMSESRMGSKNHRFGKQPDIKTAFSIHGYRNDIGHSVRSTLEANYARYLIYNKIKYMFELKPFEVISDKGKENCWIDFYLSQTDEWVETKNFMGRDIRKIELTREQYPTAKIKILYADSIEWRKIEEQYSVLIPLWETSVKNLRTHPSLYIKQ